MRCQTKHETPNTKHMMNSTFYEFIKFEIWDFNFLNSLITYRVILELDSITG